jgi:hypothetical protein
MNPIQRLSTAQHSFTDFIRALPPEKMEPSSTEKWGAREVFTHLVFWHEQYAHIAADVLARRRREMLCGTFKEINALAVSGNMRSSMEELARRWSTAQKKLVWIAQKPQARHLKFCLREGSKVWPFFVLMRLAAGHISRHEEKLRKQLGVKKARKPTVALI